MNWGEILERWFAIIGHRAPSTGELSINDLAGSGGRTDVLVRAVNAALFVSHGIRRDSRIMLHLLGGSGSPRRVLFDGSSIRGLRPDERSIAGQIKSVIRLPVPPLGRFEQVSQGISHSGGDLAQTISEWESRGITPLVLDSDGESHSTIAELGSVGFILSDDWPLTESDLAPLEGASRVSLGSKWLQGHSCISILHFIIDES